MPAAEWKYELVDLVFHNVVTIIHPHTVNDLSPFSGISRMLQRASNSARPARHSPAWNGNNARALGSDGSRVSRTRLPGARAGGGPRDPGAATAGAGGGSGRLRSAAQAPQDSGEPSPSCSL